jgi:hypothetical protein
MDVSDDE